eukprot:3437388-Pyramimonas_sp.AAC.1
MSGVGGQGKGIMERRRREVRGRTMTMPKRRGAMSSCIQRESLETLHGRARLLHGTAAAPRPLSTGCVGRRSSPQGNQALAPLAPNQIGSRETHVRETIQEMQLPRHANHIARPPSLTAGIVNSIV